MASAAAAAAAPSSIGLGLGRATLLSQSPSRSAAFPSRRGGGGGLVILRPPPPPRPEARRRRQRRGLGCFASSSALSPELKSTLDRVVGSHKVVLFMKGNKEFPQCGFSATVVGILTSLNVPFETLDVLQNDALRQALKDYSAWPTFPQLYIDGQFFGGCDITVAAYKSGELQEVLEKAMCS